VLVADGARGVRTRAGGRAGDRGQGPDLSADPRRAGGSAGRPPGLTGGAGQAGVGGSAQERRLAIGDEGWGRGGGEHGSIVRFITVRRIG
jgi:hypothetical protein